MNATISVLRCFWSTENDRICVVSWSSICGRKSLGRFYGTTRTISLLLSWSDNCAYRETIAGDLGQSVEMFSKNFSHFKLSSSHPIAKIHLSFSLEPQQTGPCPLCFPGQSRSNIINPIQTNEVSRPKFSSPPTQEDSRPAFCAGIFFSIVFSIHNHDAHAVLPVQAHTHTHTSQWTVRAFVCEQDSSFLISSTLANARPLRSVHAANAAKRLIAKHTF